MIKIETDPNYLFRLLLTIRIFSPWIHIVLSEEIIIETTNEFSPSSAARLYGIPSSLLVTELAHL